MIYCNLLETYLDGKLDHGLLCTFENHLAECEKCREAAEQWISIKQEYKLWIETVISVDNNNKDLRTDPSAFVASVLETIESDENSKRNTQKIYYFAAAAAVLFGIFGIIYYVSIGKLSTKTDSTTTENPAAEQLEFSTVSIENGIKTKSIVKGVPENIIEAPLNGRILASLKGDQWGLDSSGQMKVVRAESKKTEIRLFKGTAAFEISPKPKDSRFLVRAGKTSIDVIGTRFSISMDENNLVTVFVDKGIVSVFSEKWRFELKAGSSITVSQDIASPPTLADEQERKKLAKLLSEDLAPTTDPTNNADDQTPQTITSSLDEQKRIEGVHKNSPPRRNIEKWRTLIINGDANKAEKEIGDYLFAAPNDSEVLMLLAACQKKQNKHRKALESYKRVSESGDKKFTGRAYYLAGELSFTELNDFQGAVKFFESYLKHTPANAPNRPEAGLMQAEALIKTGANARAKILLNQIVADYGRTPIANRARELLKQVSDKATTTQ